MATALGRGLVIGIGEESTYGTAVSRTAWFRGVSCSLERKSIKTRLPRLVASSSSANRAKHFIEREEVAGDIELELCYEGMGLILKHATGGTPATTGPSGGLYTHVFKLGATLPTGLTIEVIRGTGNSSNAAEVFEGCKIAKAVFRISAGGILMVRLSIIGETATARTTAGSPSYTTNDLPVVHHQGAQFGWNSYNRSLTSFELTIDNKLVTRQFIGSLVTKEPQRSDFTDVRTSIGSEWETEDYYVGMTADTEADTSIVFSGAGSRSLTFALHNAYIDTVSSPISGPGIIMENATLIGQTDGTDEGLAITVINTQSTAVAA